MQTIIVSNRPFKDAAEATVFGPFFVDDAPIIDNGGDIAGGGTGQARWVEGAVRDTDGAPTSGARIEVWEAGTRTPDWRDLGDETWARTRFDLVLAPEGV